MSKKKIYDDAVDSFRYQFTAIGARKLKWYERMAAWFRKARNRIFHRQFGPSPLTPLIKMQDEILRIQQEAFRAGSALMSTESHSTAAGARLQMEAAQRYFGRPEVCACGLIAQHQRGPDCVSFDELADKEFDYERG